MIHKKIHLARNKYLIFTVALSKANNLIFFQFLAFLLLHNLLLSAFQNRKATVSSYIYNFSFTF